MENINTKINGIINNIPSNLTNEIEIARYVYIKLGELINYDLSILTANQQELSDIYYKDISLSTINTNFLICSHISKLYCQILHKLGIKSNLYFCNDGLIDNNYKHVASTININNSIYLADLTLDLYKIQAGLKTTHFCDIEKKHPEFSNIPFKDLKEIDNKINYTFHGLYSNEFFNQLKKELSLPYSASFNEYVLKNKYTDSPSEILKCKLDFILDNINFSNLHPSEANMILRKSIFSLLTPQEQFCLDICKLINNTDKSNPKFCNAIEISTSDISYYLISYGKKPKYISADEACKLRKQGWDIDPDKKRSMCISINHMLNKQKDIDDR